MSRGSRIISRRVPSPSCKQAEHQGERERSAALCLVGLEAELDEQAGDVGHSLPGHPLDDVGDALALRQLLVPLIGVRAAPRDTFAVRQVDGDEALLAMDDRHLDFRCGIGVDRETRLVRVTTAVRLKGWRGRL